MPRGRRRITRNATLPPRGHYWVSQVPLTAPISDKTFRLYHIIAAHSWNFKSQEYQTLLNADLAQAATYRETRLCDLRDDQLAEMLGCSRQWVSQLLGELSAVRLLAIDVASDGRRLLELRSDGLLAEHTASLAPHTAHELVSTPVGAKPPPHELLSTPVDSKSARFELVSCTVDPNSVRGELLSTPVDSNSLTPVDTNSLQEALKLKLFFLDLASLTLMGGMGGHLLSSVVDSKSTRPELVSTTLDSKSPPHELVSTPVDAKQPPRELLSTPVDSNTASDELLSTPVDSNSTLVAQIHTALVQERQVFENPASVLAPLLAKVVVESTLTPPVAASLLIFDIVRNKAQGELPLAVWRLKQVALGQASLERWVTGEVLTQVRQQLQGNTSSDAIFEAKLSADSTAEYWWAQLRQRLPADIPWLTSARTLPLEQATLLLNVPSLLIAQKLTDQLQPELSQQATQISVGQIKQVEFVAWHDGQLLHPKSTPNPSVAGYSRTLEARQLWNQTLKQLELQMTRGTFDTWLRDTHALGYNGDGHTLVIKVKNTYAVACLQNRLAALIQRALLQITGTEVPLRYVEEMQYANVST